MRPIEEIRADVFASQAARMRKLAREALSHALEADAPPRVAAVAADLSRRFNAGKIGPSLVLSKLVDAARRA